MGKGLANSRLYREAVGWYCWARETTKSALWYTREEDDKNASNELKWIIWLVELGSSRAVRIKNISDDCLLDDEVKFSALEFWRQREPAAVNLSQSSLAWETFETISNSNRTDWSPIRSVILGVINKIRRPQSGSPICSSRVWLRTELDDKKSYYQLIITITLPENLRKNISVFET